MPEIVRPEPVKPKPVKIPVWRDEGGRWCARLTRGHLPQERRDLRLNQLLMWVRKQYKNHVEFTFPPELVAGVDEIFDEREALDAEMQKWYMKRSLLCVELMRRGFGPKEICIIFGVTEGTVYKWLSACVGK